MAAQRMMALPVFGAEIAAAARHPKTLTRLIEEAYLNCAAASLALNHLKAVHAGKMQFQWGGWLQALAADADTLSENVTTFRNRVRRAGEAKVIPVRNKRRKDPAEVRRNRQLGAAKARAKIDRKNHPWNIAEHQGVLRHKCKQEEKNARAHP